MDSLNWIKNATPLLKDRFKHITCVNVQIYKLEGNSWRELTKDFVLLHMYYDREDKEAKLVAIDGIKLIVRGFVLSANLQLVRPTKKFVHFVSSNQGKSGMYGFGFQQVCEVDQFLRHFSTVYKKLHLPPGIVLSSGLRRQPSISSTMSQSQCIISSSSATSTPKKDTRPIPLFSLEDSPWREQIPQPEVDSAVQHVEKELQELSCTSDLFLAVPTLPLVSCLSRQTSVDAESSFRCINSTTSNSNLKPAIPVQYKTYQLWGTPPWSVSARPTSHQNSTTITSPCNSLLPH